MYGGVEVQLHHFLPRKCMEVSGELHTAGRREAVEWGSSRCLAEQPEVFRYTDWALLAVNAVDTYYQVSAIYTVRFRPRVVAPNHKERNMKQYEKSFPFLCNTPRRLKANDTYVSGTPGKHWIGDSVRSEQVWSLWNEWNVSYLPGIEPRFLYPPTHASIAVPTVLSQLWYTRQIHVLRSCFQMCELELASFCVHTHALQCYRRFIGGDNTAVP